MLSKAMAAGARLAGFESVSPKSECLPLVVDDTNPIEMANETTPDKDGISSKPDIESPEGREDIEAGAQEKDVTLYEEDEFHSVSEAGSGQSEVHESEASCMGGSCVEKNCDEEESSSEASVAGFGNFFDFIEQACCGETKKDGEFKMITQDGETGKGKTFSQLATSGQFKYDNLKAGEVSEDCTSLSSCSMYARSRRSATKGRSNSRNPNRRHHQHHHRRSQSDLPRERNRSSSSNNNVKNLITQDKLKAVAAVAKKASAMITKNIKILEIQQRETLEIQQQQQEQKEQEATTTLAIQPTESSAFKTSSPPANEKTHIPEVVKPTKKKNTTTTAISGDEPTCATADSTAVASHPVVVVVAATNNNKNNKQSDDHERMRKLCVLSLVGSGSSVSSFDDDGGGHSWSLHTKGGKVVMASPTDLTTLTTNKAQVEVSLAQCRRVVECVINFLDSLLHVTYGNGGALPVNKAICLLSLSVIYIFWPEDQELNRRIIERVEIPRPPSPVSLLKAVIRGETREDHSKTISPDHDPHHAQQKQECI